MVSFTGSTEVGKLMLRYAGESNMKRVALECGGKSPHVVMKDADIEAAASGIAWGIYYNAGETCHAGSRVIVHQSVKDALVEAIARVAATIPLGHPFEPATQMGALIDQGHMQRVLGYIDSGVSQGAQVALGGKRAFEEFGGYYVEATVLDGVRADMRVAREEYLGPCTHHVESFTDEAEAIQPRGRYHLRARRGRLDFRACRCRRRRLSARTLERPEHRLGQYLRSLIAGNSSSASLQASRASAATARTTRSTSTLT